MPTSDAGSRAPCLPLPCPHCSYHTLPLPPPLFFFFFFSFSGVPGGSMTTIPNLVWLPTPNQRCPLDPVSPPLQHPHACAQSCADCHVPLCVPYSHFPKFCSFLAMFSCKITAPHSTLCCHLGSPCPDLFNNPHGHCRRSAPTAVQHSSPSRPIHASRDRRSIQGSTKTIRLVLHDTTVVTAGYSHRCKACFSSRNVST